MSISIDQDACTCCGACARVCAMGVFAQEEGSVPTIDATLPCIRCGHCYSVCPSSAIIFAYPHLHPSGEEVVGIVGKDELSRHLKSNRSIRLFHERPVSIAMSST